MYVELCMPGSLTSCTMPVHERSTCDDVIEALLQQHAVTDDPQLYYVVHRDADGSCGFILSQYMNSLSAN